MTIRRIGIVAWAFAGILGAAGWRLFLSRDGSSAPLRLSPRAIGGSKLPARPVDFVELPGSGGEPRIAVLGHSGELSILDVSGERTSLVAKGQVPFRYFGESDCGYLAMAADPDFGVSQRLYIAYCSSPGLDTIIGVTISIVEGAIKFSDFLPVTTLGDPRGIRGEHNVGAIGFESSDVMWATIGDKALGQDARAAPRPLGALLRFRLNLEPDSETISPVDGNMRDAAGRPTLALAIGLRSPWRAHRDDAGRYWIADVGEKGYEEINLHSRVGQDFGWPYAEGPCKGKECSRFSDPVVSWGWTNEDPFKVELERELGRQQASGLRVAWVGPRYRVGANEKDPFGGRLTEKTIYGDMCAGWMRAVEIDRAGVKKSDALVGYLPNVVQARQIGSEIFLLTHGGCVSWADANDAALYRLELAP